MNAKLLTATVLVSGVAYAAQPAVDLDRIGKDMTIMSQIMATALEQENLCRDCGDDVSAKYLASQGVVFTIHSSVSHVRYVVSQDGDEEGDFEMEFGDVYGLSEVPDIPDIPVIVNDALSRINIDIDGDGRYFSLGTRPYLDRETREELRELARNMRRLEVDLRELEIEKIHAEEEEEREAIEGRLSDLQDEIADLEKDRSRLESIRQEKLNAYRAEQAEQRRAREAKRTERLTRIENVLLEAACDYGTTLRNLPDDEHVSLLIEHEGVIGLDDRTRVYVFDKRQLQSCERGDPDELRQKAIFYEI